MKKKNKNKRKKNNHKIKKHRKKKWKKKKKRKNNKEKMNKNKVRKKLISLNQDRCCRCLVSFIASDVSLLFNYSNRLALQRPLSPMIAWRQP